MFVLIERGTYLNARDIQQLLLNELLTSDAGILVILYLDACLLTCNLCFQKPAFAWKKSDRKCIHVNHKDVYVEAGWHLYDKDQIEIEFSRIKSFETLDDQKRARRSINTYLGKAIQVCTTLLTGSIVRFQMKPSETVLQVKHRLELEQWARIPIQRLMQNGVELQNHQLVGDVSQTNQPIWLVPLTKFDAESNTAR